MNIDNLELIQKKCKKTHYIYKNIDFLVSTYTNKILIVLFHGGRCGANIPIFRGYNYNFSNANILSFSDPLYKYYNNINIGWYLNTIKYPNLRKNIIDIINYIKEITNTDKILFVAQCSGALIATELGCIFNEYVLITNPHLILKSNDCYIYPHWTNTAIENGYIFNIYENKKTTLLGALKKDNNEIKNYDDLDIRYSFKKFGFPKKLQIFAHIDDYTSVWILKIRDIYKENNITDNCTICLHNTNCKSPHHCPLPNNSSLDIYIKKYLNIIQ